MRDSVHRTFDVDEPSQTGEIRRAAVLLAGELGFDAVAVGRVGLVATELGSNLARHAKQGRMLLAAVRSADGTAAVELISLDREPGIADLTVCLADGYSTGGTPGTGLGAVRRLADEFDAFSTVPGGTVILARIRNARTPHPGHGQTASAAGFTTGAVALCAPGETVCGDAWSMVQDDGRAALLVADGLGHGPLAAEAADAAVAVLESEPSGSPSQVLSRVHRRLQGTRGAAVAMARIDPQARAVEFCGAGNIAARLVSGLQDRVLATSNGTAGMQIRTLQDARYEWPSHALLIMHSDGIAARWNLAEVPGLLRCHPVVVAAWLVREHCRGRDDATVVVVRVQGD
jgi:anti-sigma regulatory factor (Ser/Thr protein kinase)